MLEAQCILGNGIRKAVSILSLTLPSINMAEFPGVVMPSCVCVFFFLNQFVRMDSDIKHLFLFVPISFTHM